VNTCKPAKGNLLPPLLLATIILLSLIAQMLFIKANHSLPTGDPCNHIISALQVI